MSRKRNHRYSWAEIEIIQLVVKPLLMDILSDPTPWESKTALLNAFNEEYVEVGFVNMEDLNYWLAVLDIKITKGITITGVPQEAPQELSGDLDISLPPGIRETGAPDNPLLAGRGGLATPRPIHPRQVPIGPEGGIIL